MKCLANNNSFKRAVTKATSDMVPGVTRFFLTQMIDILFTTQKWSKDRVTQFIREYEDIFESVHINHDDKDSGCSFDDIEIALLKDYDYSPPLHNTVVTAPVNTAKWRVQSNTDLCIRWIASVTALLMFDKFNCTIKTVDRVMAAYDRKIRQYRIGNRNYAPLVKKIEQEKGIKLTVEVI